MKVKYLYTIATCLMAVPVQAANLLINGSFEAVPFSAAKVEIPDYWSTTAPSAAITSPLEMAGWDRTVTYDGTNYLVPAMNLIRNDSPSYPDSPFGGQYAMYADVYQVVTGLTIGETYRFKAFGVVDLGSYVPTIDFDSSISYFNLSAYETTVFNGIIDYTLAPSQSPLASANLNAFDDGSSPAWRELSVTFTATSDEMTMRIEKFSGVNPAIAVCYWDNASLEMLAPSVPEPTTAMCCAVFGLCGLLRRQRLALNEQ